MKSVVKLLHSHFLTAIFTEEGRPYHCDICNDTLPKVNISIREYYSEACSKLFNSRTALSHHICIHTGERLYHCDKSICQRAHLAEYKCIHTR
ncbi:---NA--- [Octopus vulgaris]|uniref:---NA n=1 Tax=Octopus vulgaris TaxID=6645 RepID=A0AA36F834_OCTVU|nr:---NA--- [Octopus vulgaris]